VVFPLLWRGLLPLLWPVFEPSHTPLANYQPLLPENGRLSLPVRLGKIPA
jgi:hypothetical protein